MLDEQERALDEYLQGLAESLDIPPSKYEQAVQRYQAVGSHLEDGDYPNCSGAPEIYPQGSFRLGTVVRPLAGGEERDYDIDLVCRLECVKNGCHPKRVKHQIGDRLKAHGTYQRMLEKEGRRCWTLNYAEEDGIGFHMDVLPCVPESREMIGSIIPQGVRPQHARSAVAVTDKNQHNGAYSWSESNPKGFADWFDEVTMPVHSRIASSQKQLLLEQNRTLYASVDDVPTALVRTPLQRAIQILKRHRDTRFDGAPNEDDMPISMILTTIAASAYEHETDLVSTLLNLIDRAENYVASGIIQKRNGTWYIPNPVNPVENFADRWNDHGSKKSDAFFQWLLWVKQDLEQALQQGSPAGFDRVLGKSFGGRAIVEANSRYSTKRGGRSGGILNRVGRILRFDVAHRQPPRWPIVAGGHAVTISASVRRNGFRTRHISSDASPLPKGVDIDFEAKTGIPRPYKLFWQVVNTGPEAAAANDLRGGFGDIEVQRGGRRWHESTKYTGSHWVECFVVKDGRCLARSGEFIVNVA